jgi:DNA-binding response OmpR family regulator
MNPVPIRLLILEDEEMLAQVVAIILEEEGYSATFECDGEAGLEAALSGNFDLCLLNVILPGLDGYVIADQLQESNIDLPLIFLTETSRQEVAARTEILGLKVGYMPKPFSKRALIQKVADVLDGKGWLEAAD